MNFDQDKQKQLPQHPVLQHLDTEVKPTDPLIQEVVEAKMQEDMDLNVIQQHINGLYAARPQDPNTKHTSFPYTQDEEYQGIFDSFLRERSYARVFDKIKGRRRDTQWSGICTIIRNNALTSVSDTELGALFQSAISVEYKNGVPKYFRVYWYEGSNSSERDFDENRGLPDLSQSGIGKIMRFLRKDIFYKDIENNSLRCLEYELNPGNYSPGKVTLYLREPQAQINVHKTTLGLLTTKLVDRLGIFLPIGFDNPDKAYGQWKMDLPYNEGEERYPLTSLRWKKEHAGSQSLSIPRYEITASVRKLLEIYAPLSNSTNS